MVFGIISRYFVSEIVDAIWRDEFGMIKLDNARQFLEEQYHNDEYLELAGAIRAMYVMYNVEMPGILDALLRMESVELYDTFIGIFIYEFSEMIKEHQIIYGEDD
ncbi:MAG TPA: hypothetical protein PLH38_02710 [Clostridia bacterium]|nr:hypothetical protein [Clostridia bacterium]